LYVPHLSSSALADHATILLRALIVLWGVELELVRQLRKTRDGASATDSPVTLALIVLFMLGVAALAPPSGAAILAVVIVTHALIIGSCGLLALNR
jgi:hypothetical protein